MPSRKYQQASPAPAPQANKSFASEIYQSRFVVANQDSDKTTTAMNMATSRSQPRELAPAPAATSATTGSRITSLATSSAPIAAAQQVQRTSAQQQGPAADKKKSVKIGGSGSGGKGKEKEHHDKDNVDKVGDQERGDKDGGATKEAVTIDDLALPKSIITRLAKGVLPPNTQVQANAILALTRSTTVFINHLASAANEFTLAEDKKTIMPEHVFKAIDEIEYGFMRERLEAEFNKFNTTQSTKRSSYRKRAAAATKKVAAANASRAEGAGATTADKQGDTTIMADETMESMASTTAAPVGTPAKASSSGGAAEAPRTAKKAKTSHVTTTVAKYSSRMELDGGGEGVGGGASAVGEDTEMDEHEHEEDDKDVEQDEEEEKEEDIDKDDENEDEEEEEEVEEEEEEEEEEGEDAARNSSEVHDRLEEREGAESADEALNDGEMSE